MAMKSIAQTEDHEKVLIAAHNHPDDDPKISEVAEMLDDDYLNTTYVERIMHDFTLPPEKLEELEDNEDDDKSTDSEGDASITPEELQQRNNTHPSRNGGDEPEDDENDDESDEFESQWDFENDQLKQTTKIDRIILDSTRKQHRALLYMAAAPHPVSHSEIADAVDAAQPYIYQVDKFHDNDIIVKIDVDAPDRQRPRKLWVLTQPAASALNNYVKRNGASVRDVLEDVPNVTQDGVWEGVKRDYVLTKGHKIDTSNLAIESTLVEPPTEDAADTEPPEIAEDDTDTDTEDDAEAEDEPEDDAEVQAAEAPEPDPSEALEQLAENDNEPAKAFDERSEAKLELEELSKQSDKSAYKCDICSRPFDTYRSAKIHVTLSEEGDHKGHEGDEPGVIEMNEAFLQELAHNSEGHNGSVSVELDTDSVFVREDDDQAEDVREDEENGVPVATDSAEETPRNGRLDTVERGNVTVSGQLDGTGGKGAGNGAKRLREPTTIKNRRVKTTQEQSSDDEATQEPEPSEWAEPEGDEPVAASLSLTKDDAFELIDSDAPEHIRRRVFDAVVER